ncbi:hypothetical protein MJM95_30750, partial [Salmonella enterica subsp. enterica serovar Anatum]|nr:hypothetical protein [Salmonella enterica subsp. enterica serovar Anatum]
MQAVTCGIFNIFKGHGQPQVRSQMEIFIQAAKLRGDALDHLLIFGPPGLGKTTLANI